MLDGGLVSLSTLAPDTLACMQSMSSGAVICLYKYHPRDVLVKVVKVEPSSEPSAEPSSEPSAESSSESSESSSLEIKVDPSESIKMESNDVENKAELQLLLKRQTELSNLVDAAEMRWLELHEQLETLPEIN